MEKRMGKDRLGIGIIGSGFNARFHLKAFVGVRDADIRGIWSPNTNNSADAAYFVTAILKISFSRHPSKRGGKLFGTAPFPAPVGLIWRAQPRSTAAHTNPGFGAAICKAAVY